MKTYTLKRFGCKEMTEAAVVITQKTLPKRRGWVVIDSWPANDPPTITSDIRQIQDWDRRNNRSS